MVPALRSSDAADAEARSSLTGRDFVRAMTYPGVAVVRQIVTRVGRSSVEMSLVIEKKDEPDVIYATGRTVIVWFDYTEGKSKPWPEAQSVRRSLKLLPNRKWRAG